MSRKPPNAPNSDHRQKPFAPTVPTETISKEHPKAASVPKSDDVNEDPLAYMTMSDKKGSLRFICDQPVVFLLLCRTTLYKF